MERGIFFFLLDVEGKRGNFFFSGKVGIGHVRKLRWSVVWNQNGWSGGSCF